MADANPTASAAPEATAAASQQWPVDKTLYTIEKSVGQGATSVVYEAICASVNNRKCAIKVINLERCSNSASLDEINKEIMSMRNLKNENIVAYHASFVTGTELYIVMDLCQRGSLLDLIKFTQSKRDITTGVFDENTIATILRDVLRALVYIHENGLVHRDVKCGNLLVKDDAVIQIADFGVAGFLAIQPLSSSGVNQDKMRHTFVGTPCWMAPEVMQQAGGYNQKADIWSLGITTIELATGQAPYAKYSPMKVLMLTLQNDPPDIDTAASTSTQYSGYGTKFRKFTKGCLMKDPAQRIPGKELLTHPFIKSKAKDRELLSKVLLSGDIPPPAKSHRVDEKNAQKDAPKGASGEWNFDVSGNLRSNHPGDSDSDTSDEYPAAATTNKTAPVKPAQPAGPMYRITLRKRNVSKNNELEDISFNYVPGKDSTDVLAHELVEAGLLDGCDFVLVAHNMSELVANPKAKERTFALNSAPIQGQNPVESELHGYAKVLIREMATESSSAKQPAQPSSQHKPPSPTPAK